MEAFKCTALGLDHGEVLCLELAARTFVAVGLQLVKNERGTYNKQHDPSGHAEMPG